MATPPVLESSAAVAQAAGQQRFKHLILDTGALIKGSGYRLANLADHFWTIPEVIAEIRDPRARFHLETLPFELYTKEPTPEAVAAIVHFSRQTGDYASLSRTDIHVLALAYQLEHQEKGSVAHLRTSLAHTRPLSVAGEGTTYRPKTQENPSETTPHIPQTHHSHAPATSMGPTHQPRTQEDNSISPLHTLSAHTSHAAMASVDQVGDSSETHVPAGEVTDDGTTEDEEGSISGEGYETDSGEEKALVDGAWDEGHSEIGEKEREGQGEAAARVKEGTWPQQAQQEVQEPQQADEEEPLEHREGQQISEPHPQPQQPHQELSSPPPAQDSLQTSPSVRRDQEASEAHMQPRFPPDKASLPAPASRLSWAEAVRRQKPSVPNVKKDVKTDATAYAEGGRDGQTAGGGGMGEGTKQEQAPATITRPEIGGNSLGKKAREGPVFPVQTLQHKMGGISLSPAEGTGGMVAGERQGMLAGEEGRGRTAETRILRHGVGEVAGLGEVVDNGEGWIGVENVDVVQGWGNGEVKGCGAAGALVACLTLDYAMQNVLMQMGLHLMSLDGQLIQRLKQWARRCQSCSKILFDHDRLFCPRCGNGYLSRVPYTLDAETGELHIHLSRHYHPPKGHKYPIPAHKKDRFDRGLLLREDQLLMGLWRQKVRAKGKQVGCIFGEEVSEDLGCKVRKGGGRDGLVVGFGRKNVNAAKGRERRGKKRRG